jgi:hypothetical protein
VTDLAARRAEAEANLAALRQRRGASMLDNDGRGDELAAQIVQLEARIAGIDEARSEAVRRQRAEAQSEWEADRRRAVEDALAADAARLDAVGRAEVACRSLVEALNEVTEASQREATALARLSMARMELLGHFTAKRLSALMAPILAGLGGNKHRYGDLSWHWTGAPARDWRDAEAAVIDLSDIRPPATKPNGKSTTKG